MKYGRVWLRGVGVKQSTVGLASALIVVMLALWAPAANAQAVRLANGRFAGVYLRPGLSAAAYERQTGARPVASARRSGLAPADPNGLFWQSGQVLHTTSPYLVFWDPISGITSRSRQVLTQYLADAGLDSSNPNDVYAYRVLPQYYDATGFAAAGQTFSSGTQVINDSRGYPSPDPSTCTPAEQHGFTACITDAQIQTELTGLINTDHLPSGIGANAPIYFVVTPASVNVCMNGGGGCANNAFCAYHSSYTASGGTNVLYSSIPFTLGDRCQSAGVSPVQEPNADVADVIADNLSHENAEAITDPLGRGWLTSNGLEVGDQCEAQGPFDPNDPAGPTNPDAYLPTLGGNQSAGTLYDQLINGDHYFTQTLWSNSDDNCEGTATPGTITPTFESPASVLPGSSASFDPSGSSSTNGYSSATWSWGDGSPNTFLTGSPTMVTHTFSAVGDYTVALTLVDAGGNIARVSHTVIVGAAPAAAFSASGSVAETGSPVAFNGTASSDPNAGESIVAYSWSFGDGSPAGTGVAPSHSFTSPGTYTVTLTVAGSEGLTGAVSHAVTVLAAPLAVPSLSTKFPVAGSPVSFNGRSSTGGISAYAWNFGDGAIGSGVAPTHIYAKRGTYTATLTVTDAAGFTSSRSLSVVVAPSPISGWSLKLVSGKYVLVVSVGRAGTVRVGSAKATLKHAGKATLRLSLSRAQRHRLGQHKSVKLTIVFTSVQGPRVSKTITVKLKR